MSVMGLVPVKLGNATERLNGTGGWTGGRVEFRTGGRADGRTGGRADGRTGGLADWRFYRRREASFLR